MRTTDVTNLFSGLPIVQATLMHNQLVSVNKRVVGQSLFKDSLVVLYSKDGFNAQLDYSFKGSVDLSEVIISMVGCKKPNATLADINLNEVFIRIAALSDQLQAAFTELIECDPLLSNKINVDFTFNTYTTKTRSPLKILE